MFLLFHMGICSGCRSKPLVFGKCFVATYPDIADVFTGGNMQNHEQTGPICEWKVYRKVSKNGLNSGYSLPRLNNQPLYYVYL